MCLNAIFWFIQAASKVWLKMKKFRKAISLSRLIVCLLTAFAWQVAYSQNQTNNWYFGENAGLNFGTCSPTVLTDGETNTIEGVATISDTAGRLLFYTDGVTVWNRNHTIMLNGTGLLGNISSTHSAVIVPQPGNDSIYFVLTVGNENQTTGLNYSVVNMARDNGRGEVTSRNTLLLRRANEKIAAVLHRNNRDVWIVTREFLSNNFYSWLITSSGISNTPVISASPYYIGQPTGTSRGYLRISSDGKKLVSIYQLFDFSEMASFNDLTGEVFNFFRFNHKLPFAPHYPSNFTYGVEFSPDNKLMYVTSNMTNGASENSFLSQYKVDQFDSASVYNSIMYLDSGLSVANTLNLVHGGIQLARNGKIYITHPLSPKVSVINNPNVYGPGCQLQLFNIDVSPGRCWGGLPTFIQSYLSPEYKDFSFATSEDCSRNVQFQFTTTTNYDSIRWYFNGINTNPSNTSTSTNPVHQYPQNDTFNVYALVHYSRLCVNKTDTLFRELIVGNRYFDLGTNKTICIGDSTELNAFATGASSYTWNTNESTSSIIVRSEGWYYCDVSIDGCVVRDSVYVSAIPRPVISLGNDTTICESQSLILNAQYPGASYEWQNGTTQPTFSVRDSGLYYVIVSISNCRATDSIIVSLNRKPHFDFGPDKKICPGQTIVLDPSARSDWQLEWQDGQISQTYPISSPGTYSLTARNDCGTFSDVVQVSPDNCKLYIPGSFSPNGDGLNDYFRVLGSEDLQFFHLTVYNRYGQVVFTSFDITKAWDGKFNGLEQPTGTYIWLLRKLGRRDKKIQDLKGSVTLFR